MLSFEAVPQSLCSEFARSIAGKSQGLDYGQAKERIPERVEDQGERALRDVMRIMAKGQLGDERPDRIEDRVQGIAIAAENHPCGKRPGSFLPEGVETLVNDDPRIRFTGAGAIDGLGDTAVDRVGDGLCKFALEARRRAEMVKQVGVGAMDLRGHGLEGDRLWSLVEQQLARRRERGGAAFLGRQASSPY